MDISKIIFDVEGRKIELTKKEAKQMKAVLDELFGVKEVIRDQHYHHYPYWQYPTRDIVWCGTSQLQYDKGLQTVNCSL